MARNPTRRSLSSQRKAEATAASKPLTPKQEEVVALAHQGLTVAQAAEKLDVAESNVYNHAKRIREKGVEITFAKTGAAPVAEPPAATNGTSDDYMATARDALASMIADSQAHVDGLKAAMVDRRTRLDENRVEGERIKTEAEELGKDIERLAARITEAEELQTRITGATEASAAA